MTEHPDREDPIARRLRELRELIDRTDAARVENVELGSDSGDGGDRSPAAERRRADAAPAAEAPSEGDRPGASWIAFEPVTPGIEDSQEALDTLDDIPVLDEVVEPPRPPRVPPPMGGRAGPEPEPPPSTAARAPEPTGPASDGRAAAPPATPETEPATERDGAQSTRTPAASIRPVTTLGGSPPVELVLTPDAKYEDDEDASPILSGPTPDQRPSTDGPDHGVTARLDHLDSGGELLEPIEVADQAIALIDSKLHASVGKSLHPRLAGELRQMLFLYLTDWIARVMHPDGKDDEDGRLF